ncbi:hypothetical protein CCHR01_00592 [Colletotrichum chrysophilum]|uniref:Uncharacterized protein n=1 Tax=Colletotrichum chrysophilum TaxID=1836956 RepID=A0AAD9EM10_9PEZI|nr:hypothetical protein CCHR01_00592 [Colletotrichum chrysophilum]
MAATSLPSTSISVKINDFVVSSDMDNITQTVRKTERITSKKKFSEERGV